MSKFNLEDYETVHDRIAKFYKLYPDGRILTDMVVGHVNDIAIFKALLFKGDADIVLATGWAEETKGQGFVNKTCHIENAETSAIGRALANIGLAGDKRASREEMQKVDRGEKQPDFIDDDTAKVDQLPEDVKELFRTNPDWMASKNKTKDTIKFCAGYNWDMEKIKKALLITNSVQGKEV